MQGIVPEGDADVTNLDSKLDYKIRSILTAQIKRLKMKTAKFVSWSSGITFRVRRLQLWFIGEVNPHIEVSLLK